MGDAILNCTTGSGDLISSNNNCYNTVIDASQIVFGLGINSAIGLACYAGFVLWRGRFRVYFNRLVSPYVAPANRPPPLKLGGHWQLWSWLIPVFKLSDGALLETAGLDALMAQRVLGFGCLALLPLTILGVAVLIPVNYTSYVPGTQIVTTTTTDGSATNSTSSINDQFLRMTMSAVPHGSNVLLVHFFFTYIFIAWVCWLLVQYYKEFISLRQAHDKKLLQSTAIGRRNSLLDAALNSSGSTQIGRHLRLSLRRSSLGDLDSTGTVPRLNSGSDRPVSVRFSDGVPAGRGSEGELVVRSSGSVQSDQAAATVADNGSRLGSAGVQQDVSGCSSPQALQQQQGKQHEPSADEVTSSGGVWHVDSAAGLRQRFNPKVEPPASPFEQPISANGDTATVAKAHSLQHGPGSGLHQNGTGKPAPAPCQQQGPDACAASGAKAKGVAMWDELAEPLPLVDSADAAQFYTVLVVDEAVEEFSYRHVDSPWLWHMPTKLAGTPRLSLEALEGVITKGKALARLSSVAQRQRLEHRHRRMQVAEEAYAGLFGKDFDRIVPLFHTKEADNVLGKWWEQRLRLDRQRFQAEQLAKEVESLHEALQFRQEVAGLQQQLQRQVQELLHKVERQRSQQAMHAKRQEAAGQQQQQQEPGGDEEQQRVLQMEEGMAAEGQPPGKAAGEARDAAAPAASSSSLQPPPTGRKQRKLTKLLAQQEKVAAKIQKTEQKLGELQFEFEEAQQVAAEAMPAPCFFATFHTVQAAAQAARLNLNPMHERMMRAMPAPAPNNVNYTALSRSWMSRGTRPIVVFWFVAAMMLFPIGVFAGICGTIVSSICGTGQGGSNTLSANSSWFCSDNKVASIIRNLISSTLPAILLSVWQAIVLPLWFYACAQAEARHFSFSALDLRCANWFFWHDLLNVFIGGMLGGSIMWGLRAVINDPSSFFTILGQAAPASSNFFINYVSYRALAMTAFRLFWPHAAVLGNILKWLRILPHPETERDREAASPPINARYSRDLGVLQLTVFVVTFAYAIVSPLILPFALLYFVLTWPVWRYQMLYVFFSHYDCQGQFWIYTAHRIVICLGAMSCFTSALLATKGALALGLVLFFTSIAFLYWFDTYLTMRYDGVVDLVPAVGFLLAPRAQVDDRLYVPPPMRPKGAGWAPEWGKAWIGYGAPRYGL